MCILPSRVSSNGSELVFPYSNIICLNILLKRTLTDVYDCLKYIILLNHGHGPGDGMRTDPFLTTAFWLSLDALTEGIPNSSRAYRNLLHLISILLPIKIYTKLKYCNTAHTKRRYVYSIELYNTRLRYH